MKLLQLAERVLLPEPRTSASQGSADRDNIDAYLHTFEVIAKREVWTIADWVKIIAPFLSGESQRAYYAVETPHNDDHEALKREILARWGYPL